MQDPNMEKVFTEYPFMDVLIYYVKELAMDCIIKSESEALANETKRTEFMGDLYIQSVEKTADWRLYDYTDAILVRAGVPSNYFEKAKVDPSVIPEAFRKRARDAAADAFVRQYQEENNYYRKITGLPNLGDPGLYVPEELQQVDIGVDFTEPIHLMSDSAINILKDRGIWTNILNMYTDDKYQYLRYIKSDISIYKARKAYNFQLLYLPTIDNTVVKEKFERRFNVNRAYTLNTIYSEAHRFDSKYYDAWITIFIIIQTMIDLVSEVQEHIMNLDVFDERCVRAIFMTHGVPYYDEIPLIYQVRMMRRLHELLKYKSTAKCMIDICSVFGFDNLRIFRYFLLRDRKVDPDTDEYVFNYKTKKVLDTDQKIETNKTTLDNFAANGIPIPFPSEGFLEKGGAVFVNIDGYRLDQEKYEIIDGKLQLLEEGALRGKSKLEFLFFSNNTFNDDITQLNRYRIITESKSYPITSKNQTTFTITYPITDFFKKNGIIFVSVGSTFIDQSRYTINGNTITFTDTDWYDSGERLLSVIYVYSPEFEIKSKILYSTYSGNSNATSSVSIPQPYENYIRYGGEFFTLQGSVLLSSDRYVFNNSTLTYISSEDKLMKGTSLTFNNIYTQGKDIEMVEEWFEFSVTSMGEQDYEIKVPFKDYTESGNILEVFMDNAPLMRSEYAFLKNNIKIIDQSKVMRVGTKFKIHFVYPKDINNIKVTTKEIDIVENTNTFKIEFPYDGYQFRHDKYYILVDSKILAPSDYKIVGDSVVLTNPKYFLTSRNVVEVKFIQNPENSYTIHVKEESLRVRSTDQRKFTLNYPFYNYAKSGNGQIITVGGTVIDPSRYTINGTILTFNDSVSLDKGREVRVLFIYNSVYDTFNNYIRTEYDIYNLKDGPKVVDIPYPFNNFFESDNNNQMQILCEDGFILEENIDYEIIDDQAVFSDVNRVLEHGDTILFSFSYVNANKKEILIDDNTKNYDLKFIKAPLTEPSDNYIRDESKFINYESFTEDDWLWTNEFDPLDIKNQILEKEFNYTRTKYIAIDTVMSMSKISFQIPYFFNVFFDNFKAEERIRLQIPTIRIDKMFKLSSVFSYLFALSYIYYDKEDTIQQETVPIMYILGFNFEADLELLRHNIEKDYGFTLEELGVDGFKKYNYGTSIKGLLDAFENNTNVYNTVLKGMYYADNKRIYDAYKTVYEALMIRKYSKKFFTTNGVDTAETYTEYLKAQDKDLYNSILRIKSINDPTERRKSIVNSIMDTVKYIEIFLGSNEWKDLFNYLPGIGVDFIKLYVAKVIDFFKSYKIEIAELNTVYNFDNRYRQYIKPIDAIHYISKLRMEDFELFYDGFSKYLAKAYKTERITQDELVYILRYYFKKFGVTDWGLLTRENNIEDKIKMISKSTRIDNLKNIISKELVSYVARMRLYDYPIYIQYDRINPTTRGNKPDTFEIFEHVYISRYDKQ